jgi:plastocyanin
MHRSRPVLPIAALSLVLAACGGGGDTPSEAASEAPASMAASAAASEAAPPSEGGGGESAEVRLQGFAFDTEELTIAAGTEVSFLNEDSAPHTVTEGVDGVAVDSPIIDEALAPDQDTSFTFDEPGTYEITCLLHPQMNMTIVVEG